MPYDIQAARKTFASRGGIGRREIGYDSHLRSVDVAAKDLPPRGPRSAGVTREMPTRTDRTGALAVVLFAATLATPPARADDLWTTPYPGVRLLRRTTSRPVVFWAAVIDSCAPGVRFRATAPSEGPRVTSSFGRLVGAQLAINGDFYDHDFGLNVGNGRAWPYPDTEHSGNFSVGPNRIEMTPDFEVLPAPAPWVTEQLGGRWTLLNDGVPMYGIDDNGPPPGGFVCAPGLRHPRTAIGLSRDRRYVYLIVADGRRSTSVGMTCDELIDVFRELGAHDAMGLDGGGSSTLWSASGLINHPSDASGERTVRNHLAVFATGSGAAPHCGLRAVVTEPPQAAPVTTATPPSVTVLSPPSRFNAIVPRRAFDTRTPSESARLERRDGSREGPLTLSSGGGLRDWTALGARADATAVWLNVTAVGLAMPGFVTVFPSGRPRPGTSNVNFGVSHVVANAAAVALGDGAEVSFESSTSVDLIADLAGSFAPTGSGLAPVAPARVLDTRATSSPLRAGVTRAVDVRAPAGATGVAASVAVIARDAQGFLTAGPCGAPVPATSNLNFVPGAVVANAVLSGLGTAGLCLTSSVDVDVIVDVTGHLAPSAPLSFYALAPQRLLDTRGESTAYTGRVAAGQVITLPIQRLAGMPASVGAVVANVTAIGASTPGYVTAYPCGAATPATSTLNFAADRAAAALAVTAVGGGSLCVVSSARAHLIVDLQGVWATPPPAPMDAGVPLDAGRVDASRDAPAPPRDVVAPPRDVAATRQDVAAPTQDVTAPPRDSGRDAVGEDAGLVEESPAGCGCRAAPRRGISPWSAAALLALFARRRRRR